MKQDNISPLIETMLKSAFYSDESESTDPYLNYLGLGKITYSKRVRNGIKDLIDLMEENRSLKQNIEFLNNDLENYQKINDELINVGDFELLSEKEKKQIKKYIDNIFEEDNKKE